MQSEGGTKWDGHTAGRGRKVARQRRRRHRFYERSPMRILRFSNFSAGRTASHHRPPQAGGYSVEKTVLRSSANRTVHNPSVGCRRCRRTDRREEKYSISTDCVEVELKKRKGEGEDNSR